MYFDYRHLTQIKENFSRQIYIYDSNTLTAHRFIDKGGLVEETLVYVYDQNIQQT